MKHYSAISIVGSNICLTLQVKKRMLLNTSFQIELVLDKVERKVVFNHTL